MTNFHPTSALVSTSHPGVLFQVPGAKPLPPRVSTRAQGASESYRNRQQPANPLAGSNGPITGGPNLRLRNTEHSVAWARSRSYFASSTRVSVPGPSPTMSTQASSSLAPSQCTCLPKCVTKLPAGMGTILSLSALLPVATHQVPLTTVMKRSLGWKCGLLKLPGLNRLSATYRPGLVGSPCRITWFVPAAPVGSRHLYCTGKV